MVNCLLYQTFEYEFEFRTSKYLYFDMSLDFPLPLEFCPPPPELLRGGGQNGREAPPNALPEGENQVTYQSIGIWMF